MEDEEQHTNPFLRGDPSPLPISRPQFRKDISRARWDEELRMGEVIERKGSLWTGIGVTRGGGKLYCSIEEMLYLVEQGALHLLDATDNVLTLKDIYSKVSDGKNGCSWELYITYRRLKSLGYIVGRHGASWTSKDGRRHSNYVNDVGTLDEDLSNSFKNEIENQVTEKFSDMGISDVRPAFDVYLPNSNFKKSAPGNPSFILCMTKGKPPTREDVARLERMCHGSPLKFCHVDHWLVTFVSVEKIDLPALP